MSTVPWEPATQVGGGGMGYGSRSEGLQPSASHDRQELQCLLRTLPTCIYKGGEVLSKLLPLARQEEEEEALEDDDLTAD